MPAGSATLSLFRSASGVPGETVVCCEGPDIDHRHRELTRAGMLFDTAPTDESWLWREAHLTNPAGNRLCLFLAGENQRFPPWRRGALQPRPDQS